MKTYVISQHTSYEYEGTSSSPVAVRVCSEADIIAEIQRLDAGVAHLKDEDTVSYYYTYNELPTVGFSKDFDLANDDPEYRLISVRNRMADSIANDHKRYNTDQQNPFILGCASFKEFFLRSSVQHFFLKTIDPDVIDKIFYEVFAEYVNSGISAEFSVKEEYPSVI